MALSRPDERISQRLLRRAENSELPLAALEAIVEVRDHLRDLEFVHIESARDKGASWEDIGDALGITRQALQQRLRHREQQNGDAKNR